jgi:hypothetical protein
MTTDVAPILYLRFHLLSLWTYHRVALLILAISLAASASAAVAWWAASNEHARASTELAKLLTRSAAPAPVEPPPLQAEPALPPFDGRRIVELFDTAARDVGLPLEEVTYGLESSADQPYRRYRISTSVKASYPHIRRFVAALAAEARNVSLDGIRCARENSTAPAPKCELSFSAFYRRGDGG